MTARIEMRFLGIGDYCDLAALYLRLIEEGHEIKISIASSFCQGTLAGMVEHVPDWRAALPWIRSAGREGMLLFENVAHGSGALQDRLRADGFNVIGGSAFGDRLENDRAFGLDLLARVGLQVARATEFSDVSAALADLEARPRRCVFKVAASAGETFVGSFDDG